MLKRSITVIGLGCMMSGIPCFALDLGPVQQQSYVDEPLLARVDILDVGELNIDSISVVAADSAEFQKRGLSVKNFVGDLETKVIRADGNTPFVQLSSTKPVQSAVLTFALKAQWENGSVIQQYTVLLKDPPADNAGNFLEDSALSALSDLEMLESEPMSTQPDDNNETVWNLDNDLANRTEWKVSDERSLHEIAVHIRPSNKVSIEQTLIALIKKNAGDVQQRQSLAVSEGDVVQLPTQDEIASVNKLSAAHELGALQARFQVDEAAANESGSNPASTADPAGASPQQTGRLSLGSPTQTAINNASSARRDATQQNNSRTKSTDLARRLENAVARLGDANHIINTHIHEINELNLLVEDLKHTIDLKNAELADMQARALGAIQAQDSLESSNKAANDVAAETIQQAAQEVSEETADSTATTEAVQGSGSSVAPTRSILGGFLVLVAAMFSFITFARFRARLAESKAREAALRSEQSSAELSDEATQDTNLQFEDEDLQQLLDKQKGSVIGEAEVLTAHGLHDQAIKHLQLALDEQPESAELIGALREAFILSGRYEQAAELFPELESANDNAVIDSDYTQQTLVIDDLEEPFDESKPPVWEPPTSTEESATTSHSPVTTGVDAEPVDKEQTPSLEKSSASQEYKQTVVAQAHAQTEQAPAQVDVAKENSKAIADAEKNKVTAAEKAAARKQSRRAKKAKVARRQQGNKASKSKNTAGDSKKIQFPEAQHNDQLTTVHAAQSVEPVKLAKELQETKNIDQQVESDKDNSDMFSDNSDFFTEVEATPFELVQAYIELDDRAGARRMLEDILGDGKPNEKARAKELLEEIA